MVTPLGDVRLFRRLGTSAVLACLLALAACRDPIAGRISPQDSVVVALPTLALAVEVTPATIALGDTATIRVTLANRSATPVAVDIGCGPVPGYVIETPAGDAAAWFSRTLCDDSITRVHFASGEVRTMELHFPGFGRQLADIIPGEYRVRATFGTLSSTPTPLVITESGEW